MEKSEYESLLEMTSYMTSWDKERLLKVVSYYDKHKNDPEFLEVWKIMWDEHNSEND